LLFGENLNGKPAPFKQCGVAIELKVFPVVAMTFVVRPKRFHHAHAVSRLTANGYAAPMQQVFDLAKRQWETNIHHHGPADNLWRLFEIAEWDFHSMMLRSARMRGIGALPVFRPIEMFLIANPTQSPKPRAGARL
jgi:hypothetical protein